MIESNKKFETSDIYLSSHNKLDVKFENVHYSIKKLFVKKEILCGINGIFRSEELTAIMGPSGSGKSTMLNVMSGYTAKGVTGTFEINGVPKKTNSESYRRHSCYIQQNDLLRTTLTISELMTAASHLKLGFKRSQSYKYSLVNNILKQLGLEKNIHTLIEKLSGGEKKRLSIALELISNPPVIYLDEPTTGLDSTSALQCLRLLKDIAKEGHTVVCTIHQPSALMFEMFDKLYTLAEGNCIYQGKVTDLGHFLNGLDFYCPKYHNLADFLLEIAIGDYERDLEKLKNSANKKYFEDSKNYHLNKYNSRMKNFDEAEENVSKNYNFDSLKKGINSKDISGTLKDETRVTNASYLMQYILLLRIFILCASRNYFFILSRILSHLFIGIIFGYLYLNVGTLASSVFGNYVYIYGTLLLLVYTGKMAVVLTFPMEIDVMSKEHFNRWYNLGPYFMSIISYEIPFQIFCVTIYIGISYYLTGNSLDDYRYLYFLLFAIMVTLCGQAWGYFFGATLPIKLAVFAGPILACVFSVFGFCTRYIDIIPLFRWMWHISYFRAGFHGSVNAIYGMNRSQLYCPETTLYCHFRSPKYFLSEIMISDVNNFDSLLLMTIVIITMYSLTILVLWYKLTKR